MTSLTVVRGIDISQWQDAFPWRRWAGQIGFAMAKATEGDAETDPDFAANWAAMFDLQPDHRLPRFSYGFFRASLDPVAQAAHLVATAKGHGLLPGDNLVVDFEETIAGSGENDGIPASRCAPLGVACLRKVNELAPGHRVLPYMNPAWAKAGGGTGMESWSLWLASYGVSAPAAPPPWERATFWQYTADPIDGDRFMGTEAELLEFCRMPDKR